MRSSAGSFLFASVILALGCDPEAPPVGSDAGRPDAPAVAMTDAPVAPIDAGPEVVVAGGDVEGDWCGAIHVTAAAHVASGTTLTVCAGSLVRLEAGVSITVDGTLNLDGTSGAPIRLERATAGSAWGGLDVTGTLDGDFTTLASGTVCLTGRAGSALRLDDSAVTSCARSMALANGGTFDRTQITGGATLTVTGGILRMVDSVLDLEHDTLPPDCTDWRGGGAVLDHVRFTGCHCPIHINSSSLEVTVTNSIFDGATNTVMISNSVATFHANDFIGTGAELYDLDDIARAGLTVADVSGNYWGGGAPTIQSARPAQFSGVGDFATTRIAGAGPR